MQKRLSLHCVLIIIPVLSVFELKICTSGHTWTLMGGVGEAGCWWKIGLETTHLQNLQSTRTVSLVEGASIENCSQEGQWVSLSHRDTIFEHITIEYNIKHHTKLIHICCIGVRRISECVSILHKLHQNYLHGNIQQHQRTLENIKCFLYLIDATLSIKAKKNTLYLKRSIKVKSLHVCE